MVSASLELRDIAKTYPGVVALKGVSVQFAPARVTAIVGENGAGKSTLIKVLAGAVQPDNGQVLLDGEQLGSRPDQAIAAGINVIYQELTDVPDMSIAENVLLGRMPHRHGVVDRREARGDAAQALSQVGLADLDLDRPVGTLTLAQRQLIEIARCLARRTRVLVLDEPTSSLHEKDKEVLLGVLRRLRDDGITVLYVSHHLAEVFDLSDHIVVMRDGEVVTGEPTSAWTEDRVVSTMLARNLEHAYPWRPREVGAPVLDVQGLVAPGVRGIDLTVREHEVVGLVGLAGAGRTETMLAIAGAAAASGGTVVVDGNVLPGASVSRAQTRGVFLVPEDRKKQAVIAGASIQDSIAHGTYNLVSSRGVLRPRQLRRLVTRLVRDFGIKTRSRHQLLAQLSGGNQQKVILARAAARRPRVLLLDDPTRGVDVGAKAAVYEEALAIAEEGAGIILASSETDEVLAMADRVYVLRLGRIVASVDRSDFNREQILRLAAAG